MPLLKSFGELQVRNLRILALVVLPTDFIINYDIKYGMGKELEGGDF